MTKRIGVVAVFLVGCAVGGVSSQLVVPKASAQQAATLTRWEYTCARENHIDKVQAAANQLGQEAWELTGVDGSRTEWTACFKRPKM